MGNADARSSRCSLKASGEEERDCLVGRAQAFEEQSGDLSSYDALGTSRHELTRRRIGVDDPRTVPTQAAVVLRFAPENARGLAAAASGTRGGPLDSPAYSLGQLRYLDAPSRCQVDIGERLALRKRLTLAMS